MSIEAKAGEPTKRHRQVIQGVVVSDKMNKTRVIEIKRTKKHSLYHKAIVRNSRIFVHDEKNESRLGDTVSAEATRRLAGNKNFRLLKIEKKAEQ